MDTLSPHQAPTLRTVRLRAALAIGAAAVAGAFGTGYVLAQQLDEPARVTVPASPATHTFGDAAVESLALKHHRHVEATMDIRMRRIR